MTPKKRFEILKRDGFRCVYCGRCPPEVKLEVDHVRPNALLRDDRDGNLVACCRECNIGKGKNENDIAVICGPDGKMDHEKSMRVSGVWDLIDDESREIILGNRFVLPLEVALLSVREAEDLLKQAHRVAFQARGHEWLTSAT